MTRTGKPAGPRGHSYDPDVPEVGCWRIKMGKGTPDSAVRIWLGFPADPETGEELSERPYSWQCTVNGTRTDFHRVWPGCARHPISREEHDRLVKRNRTMDPASPFYDPKKAIDIGRVPPPF